MPPNRRGSRGAEPPAPQALGTPQGLSRFAAHTRTGSLSAAERSERPTHPKTPHQAASSRCGTLTALYCRQLDVLLACAQSARECHSQHQQPGQGDRRAAKLMDTWSATNAPPYKHILNNVG